MKMCLAEGCDQPVGDHGAKGFCPLHYKRFARTGDPLLGGKLSLDERWAKRENRAGAADCWEWSGGRDADGYGIFTVNNYPARAHRVAWERANDQPVPAGLHVLHSCDNPPCVNPAHLFVGTVAENNRDKMTKGRHRGNPDPWASQRRLTAEQVDEIRAYGNPHRHARSELAKKYGVTYQHIMAIQSGQRR